MEDSSVAMKNKSDTILPLGMNSFTAKGRQQFCQKIRIAMACIEGSAAPVEVKRLCSEYRWAEDETHDGDNESAVKQWESRSLSWDEVSNGSTRIQLV